MLVFYLQIYFQRGLKPFALGPNGRQTPAETKFVLTTPSIQELILWTPFVLNIKVNYFL